MGAEIGVPRDNSWAQEQNVQTYCVVTALTTDPGSVYYKVIEN